MAFKYDPFAWTGRRDPDDPLDAAMATMERYMEKTETKLEDEQVPSLKYEPTPANLSAYSKDQLAEYIAVAESVGVAPPDLKVEEFKMFLLSSGITVFDRATVVEFMDKKSMIEGKGWGWQWAPLRQQDAVNVRFGTAAVDASSRMWDDRLEMPVVAHRRPASDYFDPNINVYNKVVPLHALKKVALIEKEFKHKVAFAVSDYAPAPAFKPDPFLLAFIPNAKLTSGEGRFVIDVWDEPGFGIEHMLKSGI